MSGHIIVNGEPFFDSGEWFPGPLSGPPIEAQIAAHDYAHEGCYYRLVPLVLSDGVSAGWRVYLRPGRENLPACCKPKKRTYVDEPTPPETWEPRMSDVVRARLRSQARAAG